MWAEKRPHEWLGGVLGVLGLAPSAHASQINQKVLKGYNPQNWHYQNVNIMCRIYVIIFFRQFGENLPKNMEKYPFNGWLYNFSEMIFENKITNYIP